MEHEGYLLVLVSGLGTFIRTGNPRFFNEMCQIWSELIHLIQHRFGELPAALRLRLEGASQSELEHLADRVLDATSLDDLFQ
jgi:hypothetical protein